MVYSDVMPSAYADPTSLLPLTPELFHILLALADTERHGYGLVKQVERATGGAVRLAPSPLYRRLKRLMEQGIVAESERRPAPELDDERRRYYRLTAAGRKVLRAEARRLVALAGDERVRGLAGATEGGGG